MRPEHLLNYGFTPTCQAALERLAGLLSTNGGVIRLFDPCCGEGAALVHLGKALLEKGAQVETLAVEIEQGRAEIAARYLDKVINADFRRTAMTHKSVSLAFLNPPYDNTGGEDSLEKTIIRRALPYLVDDGVAVLVIPTRLLEWAESKLRMRWLALFPTEDPNSPNQVMLVGAPAREPNPLPEMDSAQPVSVPSVKPGSVQFRVTYLTENEMQAALAKAPLLDLHPAAAEAGRRVIHPLRAGHRAAYLAGHNGTLELPGGRFLRVSIQRTEIKREDETEDGQTRRVTLSAPKMVANILEGEELREIPFEQITDLAAEIDQAISLQTYVDEQPDGMPITEAWEQAVIEQINARLPRLGNHQGLLPAQAVRAVGMARALLNGEKAVFAVMEMGTGKTPCALTARALIAARKPIGLTVVLCPPHLVKKWKREAERLAPDAKVLIPEGDGEQRQAQVRKTIEAAATGAALSSSKGQEVILVLSREAVKLGPLHRVAVIPKEFPEFGRKWVCPHCMTPAVTKTEEGWGREQILRFGELITARQGAEPPRRLLGKSCPVCKTPYATPENKPRRWPLAEAIYRAVKSGKVRNLYLIADEVHEYRNASLQGTAFSRLFRVSTWAVLLTGTLFGGKASDLYRLLRWTSPEFRRMGMAEKEFIEEYGYAESVEIVDDKRSYGRRVRRSEFRERPGVSPAIFRFLLGRTAFGALRDVAAALPGYAEEKVITDPPALGLEQKFDRREAGRLFHEKGRGALSAWLRAALGYYNIAAVQPPGSEAEHVYDFVSRNEDGDVVDEDVLFRLPVLPPASSLPKEEKLLALLRQQKAQRRKTVILVEQTTVRPLPQRLLTLLKKAGLRATYLDTAKVSAQEREEWIEKHAHEMDVLITHPKAVETGLDLVMFQTVIAYEAIYAVISLSQAVCRVFRLGQTQPVQVYSLAYAGIEAEAWNIIAKKIAWQKSLYGDFIPSSLGDAGVDANLDLLRALTEQITTGKADVQMERGVINLAGIELPVFPMPEQPIPAPEIFIPRPAPVYADWQEWARQRGVSAARRSRTVQQPAQSAQLSLL